MILRYSAEVGSGGVQRNAAGRHESSNVPRLENVERDPPVVVKGLRVTYASAAGAVPALGPLDLRVGRGEFVSVVGPSGCGKSTFVKVIAGLVEPTAGRIDLTLANSAIVPVATVFQDFGIFPWKTALANVEFGLRVNGVAARVARDTSLRWLDRLGLSRFINSYPAELSGGMKQRVAIARAFATEPEILLMDEPFASLDAQLRELLQEELLSISQTEGRTVIFITHSLDEALILADTVVVMSARPGRAIAVRPVPLGRPRSLAARETDEFAALRHELWNDLRREVQEQVTMNEAQIR